MQKEKITDKEAIFVTITFILGSTLIIGVGGEAKQDAWIAGIVGIIMVIPVVLIYSRILSLYPGMDLFDILEELFGKVIGKALSVLFSWYAFHLGALVLLNFGQFINIVVMNETPLMVMIFSLGLLCIAAARSGIELIVRTNTFFLPIIFFILIGVQFFAIPQLHFEYLKPILENGFSSVLKPGYAVFSLPFAETILFLGVFSALKTKKSPYKVYLTSIGISGFFIIVSTIRNILVLGSIMDNVYFPAHIAVSLIRIGEYIQRIEITVAIVLVVTIFTKAAVCLLVACKGIEKIFHLKNYRSIVIQTGLLMIYFSYFVYDNAMMMFYWAQKIYPYYAFPMQVALPILVWILAEKKNRKKLKQEEKSLNLL